jgi:hypothetical protein
MQNALNAKRPVASLPAELPPSSALERESRVAEAAYYRAQKRNFVPGCELEDWLAAEQEIDALAKAAT